MIIAYIIGTKTNLQLVLAWYVYFVENHYIVCVYLQNESNSIHNVLKYLYSWLSLTVFYSFLVGQLETVETETRNGKRKWSKLDVNEC